MTTQNDLEIIRRALYSGQISSAKVDAQRALNRLTERAMGSGHSRIMGYTDDGTAVHGLANPPISPKAGHLEEALTEAVEALQRVRSARRSLSRAAAQIKAAEVPELAGVDLASDCLANADTWAEDLIKEIAQLRAEAK